MSGTQDQNRPDDGGRKTSLAARIYDFHNPVFSRSSKLHRPRGLLCSAGLCPNCMMEVDGVPNVRVCECESRGSPEVKMQNRIPVADRLNVLSRLHRFIGVGFQYRMMYSGRSKRRLFYSILKRASGLGVAVSDARPPKPRLEELNPAALVVGGGAAGLSAALEASKGGEDVLLVDSSPHLGGDAYSRYRTSKLEEVQGRIKKLQDMIAEAGRSPKIRVLTDTRIIGYYRNDDLFAGVSDEATYQIRTRKVVVATGSHEVLPLFTNNDAPRVMLSLSAQVLLNSGADIGRRAAILDVNGDGMLVAADLVSRGMEVTLVSIPGEGGMTEEAKALAKRYGIASATHSYAVEAFDSGLKLTIGPETRKIATDSIVVCGNYQPNYELAVMLGCRFGFLIGEEIGTSSSLPGEAPMRVAVSGSLAQHDSFEDCLTDGRSAGAAIRDGGPTNQDVIARLGPDEYLERALRNLPREAYVCLCEDVTLEETIETIKAGYSNVEMLKRFTGALTGPCQGKQCALTVAAILATTGLHGPEASPFTTTRPPIVSVPFARIAAGD